MMPELLVIPLLMFVTGSLVYFTHGPTGSSYVAVLLFLFLLFTSLEKLIPSKKALFPEKNFKVDLFFILLNPILMVGIWFTLMRKITTVAYDPFHLLNSSSLLVQTLIFFSAMEFLRYWAHRLQHELPLLWKFHAVHHCMPQMYNLNQFVSHPIDYFLRNVLTVTPLLFFKFNPLAMAYSQGISTLFGILGHSNLRIRNGFW